MGESLVLAQPPDLPPAATSPDLWDSDLIWQSLEQLEGHPGKRVEPQHERDNADYIRNKLCGWPQQCPRPCKLTFDLLTLKVVSESRVTWATSVPILVFLGLYVLD